MRQKKDMDETDAKKEYLKILLQQYSESWQAIRNHSDAVWQIPLLLVTTISVIGIVYGQLQSLQIARILVLLLGLGFTLVSAIALVKHRFFTCCRTRDFEKIENQLKKLLEQKEFEVLFKDHEFEFREIKFKSSDLAKDCYSFYGMSAYKWQLGLTLIILSGIVILLFIEFAMFLKPYV
jgi:hypothetical protein